MKDKLCRKCGILKPVREFYKRTSGRVGYHYMCKSCMKLYYKKRWDIVTPKEREKRRGRYRQWFNEIKDGIFDHYGRICECCGEAHLEFLTVDHKNGGGTKHRKILGGGVSFFKWLRDNNYPPEYRILCINCNFSMGRFGYCPHEKGR